MALLGFNISCFCFLIVSVRNHGVHLLSVYLGGQQEEAVGGGPGSLDGGCVSRWDVIHGGVVELKTSA